MADRFYREKPSTDTYTPPTHGWTCFHCGETFHVEVQAHGHFGSDVNGEPMCVMRANAFARFPRTEWPLMYRMRELEGLIRELLRDELFIHGRDSWFKRAKALCGIERETSAGGGSK